MRKFLLLLVFLPSIASAFGGTGHRIICEIAFLELDAQTQTEVSRLISLDTEYESFADSCYWADKPRRRSPDHYINIPRDQLDVSTDECPLAETYLFPAIKKDLEVFSDKSRSDEERLDALKFLGHWVGDIHQPLHVSFQDDRGGNNIDVRGMCRGTLHGVWDGCIIERQLGKDANAIANDLYESITEHEKSDWQSASLVEWANESYQITLSPETGYCTMKTGSCWYWSIIRTLEENAMQREWIITQDYLTTHQEVIELRLKQAGVRLAEMLRKAL